MPKNNTILLTKPPNDWFMLCAIVSTSFVTLDNVSPIWCLSKYFSGNLFIFIEILLLNFLANLLDTSAIATDCI